MRTVEDIYGVLDVATFSDKESSDMKRSNANIDCDSSMGAMLAYGTEVAKMWVDDKLLDPLTKKAVDANWIYIHDKDFYGLTETCCQIEIDKLFERGFNTGHGYIRPPKSITSAAALTCIVLQSNQNEMHGGQAIPAFDWQLAPYVEMSYHKHFTEINHYSTVMAKSGSIVDRKNIPALAWEATVRETYQAMEALIHNLNTMHSRAGAQVPFSSINYGTCTNRYGRLIIEAVLRATENGLGQGETPIFPVQIFKVKDGVNYESGTPNHDLLLKAISVSSKRLFPNFSFMDAPFNAQYLDGDDWQHEVSYMGCRTRVMGNIHGEETTGGRGNLSFTTVNLVKCALDAYEDCPDGVDPWNTFVENVEWCFREAAEQLMARFKIQAARHVYNYPFLMGNGVWRGSEELSRNDEVGEVLKQGSLSIGFIGLAEAMIEATGHHHGEDQDTWEAARWIVAHMRDMCDSFTEEYGMNFALLATPAEGLSGKFVPKDREEYGIIEGVTDKDYYTNSFHIPVYYDCTVYDKITKEAPFHALCNGGHITYVELDGDPHGNPWAMGEILKIMHDSGIGYGSVNHPVDRDPVCGYTGIIGDVCPCCGRREFEAVR